MKQRVAFKILGSDRLRVYNNQQIEKSVKSLSKLWKRQNKRLSLSKNLAINIAEYLQITFNIK